MNDVASCGRAIAWCALLTGLVGASPPGSQPRTVLRMAAIAPAGSGWSEEGLRFSRRVEAATGGALQVKWYFGSVAGNELTALDRVAHGQLDGAAGAIQCEGIYLTTARGGSDGSAPGVLNYPILGVTL